MSHTSTIKSIQIKDRRAIEQAVQDLKATGIQIELRQNEKPRMYYAEQANEVGNCDYVLKLPGSRYDVGLKWDAKAEEFTVYLDTWAGEVNRQIGATCEIPRDQNARGAAVAIGRFVQRYGVNAAKNAFLKQLENDGSMAVPDIREVVQDNGDIALEMSY